MTKVQILRASVENVAAIAPLFDHYRQFYKRISDLAAAKSFLAARLKAEQSVIFYATIDQSQPIGFVQLYPSFSSLSLKPVWILNDLFVEPAYRGKGVGKALILHAQEFARSTSAVGLTFRPPKPTPPPKHSIVRLAGN